LVEWIVIALVLLVLAALLIATRLPSGRVSNVYSVSMDLEKLARAEADFRSNDRDGNRVNDYWTGDVKGLHTMTSAAVRGAGGDPTDPPLRLIGLQLAAADADDRLVLAGGENMDLGSFSVVSSTKRGYWFAALTSDMGVIGSESTYRQDTGGVPPMGTCHNLSKFGFVALPDSVSSGPFVYIVNENNTIMRSAVTTAARTGRACPPGLGSIPDAYLNWPDAARQKQYWSKLEYP
jgi:hypothetical protein